MTAVTPTDRPKSVRNRCVIKVFCGVFCAVTLLFGFFCGGMGFCQRIESDLFLFLDDLILLLSIFVSVIHSPLARNTFVPPRGNFVDLVFLKEHYIRNILSHVCTLAVGAFRIFGVKHEKLCKNH